jgi:hypothetical protein
MTVGTVSSAPIDDVTPAELLDALRWGGAAEQFAGPSGGAVRVHVAADAPRPDPAAAPALASLPLVVVVTSPPGVAPPPAWLALADVALDADDPSLADIAGTVGRQPIAATALALLLRGHEHRTVPEGLTAESAVYSALQAGPEFASWRRSRPARRPSDVEAPSVRTERAGDVLHVTLTRPEVHNAFDARMRDGLIDALRVAAVDRSIARVELRGAGPSFCSGGDLDEFGTRPDPATAHLVRLHRSAARALWAVRDRTVVHVHGACMGSGIELAAFAGTVRTSDDARIGLPEVSLGLVPGAGGTVSIPARIGRHRTLWLALSGRSIDGATALDWGLADTPEAAGG